MDRLLLQRKTVYKSDRCGTEKWGGYEVEVLSRVGSCARRKAFGRHQLFGDIVGTHGFWTSGCTSQPHSSSVM